MDIPVLKKGQKVFLNFGSIRSRAEIFINQRLVDYQIVDNVSFETDITPYIKSGEQVQLAVRITDAGGNHDWRDSRTIPWGDKMLPPGHGFGGITEHCHNTGPHKHIHHFRPNCLFILSFYSVFILYFHILKFPVVWSIFIIILS